MKPARQEKILELISRYEVETQEELAARLKEAGFNVTQATVSRDIRALGLTKVVGKNQKFYYAPLPAAVESDTDRIRVFAKDVSSVEVGQNIVVIRTIPGMAMGMATALDAMKLPQLLGCIAGDDTIFCACPSEEEAVQVRNRLIELFSTGIS